MRDEARLIQPIKMFGGAGDGDIKDFSPRPQKIPLDAPDAASAVDPSAELPVTPPKGVYVPESATSTGAEPGLTPSTPLPEGSGTPAPPPGETLKDLESDADSGNGRASDETPDDSQTTASQPPVPSLPSSSSTPTRTGPGSSAPSAPVAPPPISAPTPTQ